MPVTFYVFILDYIIHRSEKTKYKLVKASIQAKSNGFEVDKKLSLRNFTNGKISEAFEILRWVLHQSLSTLTYLLSISSVKLSSSSISEPI